jgi:hypothetical protein
MTPVELRTTFSQRCTPYICEDEYHNPVLLVSDRGSMAVLASALDNCYFRHIIHRPL